MVLFFFVCSVCSVVITLLLENDGTLVVYPSRGCV